MTKYYVVKEYDCLVRGLKESLPPSKYICIPEKTFDELEKFILSSNQEDETDPIELMSISSKKGIGKIIRVKNYVGLIQMKDGTKIEVLPKIHLKGDSDSEDRTRRIFLKMLRSLNSFAFKQFNFSSLGVMKHNLFEIFIKMFIEEVRELTKKGIRSGYVTHEDNETFLKGKLDFTQHLKKNAAHKERFYIKYDIYSQNRIENKLIKATLKKLYKQSSNLRNKRDIEQLLMFFELVEESVHHQDDLKKVKLDRSMKDYEVILKWCSLFLLNKSFTPFSGQEVAYALLFSMEKVFEAYVANLMKKELGTDYTISTQDKSYHLFDQPKKFRLIPDIVVRKEGSAVFVIDTKWKVLHGNQRENYGISQSDMYQMYAYAKKYQATRVVVIYPLNDRLEDLDIVPRFVSFDGVRVDVEFVDLEDVGVSLEGVVRRFGEDER
ncbi:McrC family protein [Bacillus suaedae]|uniref:McrC family protein n=1 Tax=Halalkalibacter suaedae TaxID=2822140 RepID=A0A940WWL8_9BACI|nr:McrC family protein [Bacillus suaedae]MBP3951947.1 McrC family protein [Bacillus suaedae]